MKTLPSERRDFRDEETGARVTQWTAQRAMHHHFYFTNPTLSADGRYLFGVTYRFRYPNMIRIDTASGEMCVLTDADDLNAFSASPDAAGERIYFSAQDEVRCVDTHTGKAEVLARLDGGKLGNCSLSHDEKFLAVARREKLCRLMLIETSTGKTRAIIEKADVGHIQFNPRDASILEYSGPIHQRIWTIRADGSEDTLLYPEHRNEWIVHEFWSACGEEVIFTHWPHALKAVNHRTREVRTIAAVNAWHGWRSPDGKQIVADTNHPDRGLLLIDSHSGAWKPLCFPRASCQGTQWTQPLPASGAGIDISIIRGANPSDDQAPHPQLPPSTYGPQWTHPHPTFSADGRRVIFTSDRNGGWSQIYSVEI